MKNNLELTKELAVLVCKGLNSELRILKSDYYDERNNPRNNIFITDTINSLTKQRDFIHNYYELNSWDYLGYSPIKDMGN